MNNASAELRNRRKEWEARPLLGPADRHVERKLAGNFARLAANPPGHQNPSGHKMGRQRGSAIDHRSDAGVGGAVNG